MQPDAAEVDSVLGEYPFSADRSVTSCRPGFSGALVWRVRTGHGEFALRRWPVEHPSADRLAQLHRVLKALRAGGFELTPLPCPSRRGETIVEYAGHLWEATTWMPGAPLATSSEAHVQAACQAVAEFHRGALPLRLEDSSSPSPAMGTSPGLLHRRQLLSRWLEHDIARLNKIARLNEELLPCDWPEAAERGRRIVRLFELRAAAIGGRLAEAAQWVVPLQICLRDIRRDHVLFQNERVSGLIDFGAMRLECRSGDLARLLGELAGEDERLWRLGLEAYEKVFPLSEDERRLVTVFDESGVLLSGMNWLRWIYLEQRRFDDRPAVIARLDELLVRQNEHLGGAGSGAIVF